MKTSITVFSGLLLLVNSSYALDTTEAFDPGFSDVEVYMCYQGLDSSSELSLVSSGFLLGIGVTETFSASLSYSNEADGYLANAEDCTSIGLFWTAAANETYQLDFFVSSGTGGNLALGIESNIDFSNWGFQTQIEESIGNEGTDSRSLSTRLQPLLYYRLCSGVELLSAVDFEYSEDETGENSFDYSSVALGVNIPVTESVELISEFDLINIGDDETAAAVSVGFVAGV